MYFHSSRKGYEGKDYEQPESDKIATRSATNIVYLNRECQRYMLRPRLSENNKILKFNFFSKYCQVPGTMVC